MTVCKSFPSLSSLWHFFSTFQFPRGLFHIPLFRKIGFSSRFSCHTVLQNCRGLLQDQKGKKIETEKKVGDTLHTFQTISPFWTRAVGFHLWLTSLLSCLNNTVLQMGWSLDRVRREKKRNGEVSLHSSAEVPPSSHLDRTGGFSCCICSSVVAGVSVRAVLGLTAMVHQSSLWGK